MLLIACCLVFMPANLVAQPARRTCLKVNLLEPPNPRKLTVTHGGAGACPKEFALCMTKQQADETFSALMDLVLWIQDTLTQCHKGNGV